MKQGKMANPSPAHLLIVNPTGVKKMTRRKTSRRRTATTSARKRHNPMFSKTARKRVSTRGRRRNPAGGGLVAQGLALAAGAALIQSVLGFVPPIGGVTPIADAARTAGTGYLLSVAMDKFNFLKTYSRDVALAGFTLAGGKLISSFILPMANRVFQPVQAPAPAAGTVAGLAPIYRGMQPFGQYGSGMNGIAMIDPGMQPFGEYAN